MEEFANLQLDLYAYMAADVVTILELYFSLKPIGRFKNEPLLIFDELERQQKWGRNNTSFFKKACKDRNWQNMVDLIENYERRVAPTLIPTIRNMPIPQNSKSGQKVFISYCNAQRDEVEKIKAVLEKNNISVEYEPGYLVDIPTFMKKSKNN